VLDLDREKIKVVLTPIVSSVDGSYCFKVKTRDTLELRLMKEKYRDDLVGTGNYEVVLQEGWHE